jgi:hypothetical protein
MSDVTLGKMLLDLARDGSLIIDGRGQNQVHLGDPLTLEAEIRNEWLALIHERQADADRRALPLRTKTGRVLTDADIERLADEAEKGYDVDKIIERRAAEKRYERPLGVEETAVLRVLSAEPGLVPVLQRRLREHGGMRFTASEILVAVRMLCARGLARKREDGYVKAE